MGSQKDCPVEIPALVDMELEFNERSVYLFYLGVPPRTLPFGLNDLAFCQPHHGPFRILHQVLPDELPRVLVDVVPDQVLRLPNHHLDVLVGNVAVGKKSHHNSQGG